MQPSIYLDNNATTQIAPEVLQAMTECWEAGFANPGSQHAFGRAARTRLEDARESIAADRARLRISMKPYKQVIT